MAGGAGGARGEHDEHDRAFFAGALIAVGLLGAGLALAHRTHLAHSSRPGDACPVTASGGMVGLDARTGAVRWTNVVPSDTALRVDEEAGDVEGASAEATSTADHWVVSERTIDPSTGAVTGCERHKATLTTSETNELRGFSDPLEPPVHLGEATIVKWGNGIRATDPTNTGIWGVESARAEVRIGDDLIVSTRKDDRAGTARLDLRTGEERWSVDEPFITTGDDAAIVLTGSQADATAITGRDAATGEPRWSTHLSWPDPTMEPWNQGFDLGRMVVFPAGPPGAVIVIDATTGRLLWKADAGSPGKNWKYSNPGSVTSAVLAPDGDTVVVAVPAWIPDDFYD